LARRKAQVDLKELLGMKSRRSGKKTPTNRESDKYLIPILAKTIDVLDCFRNEQESLN